MRLQSSTSISQVGVMTPQIATLADRRAFGPDCEPPPVKRAGLTAVALIPAVLLVVRAIVRYNEQTAANERVFGTPAEREAATSRIIASQNSAEAAGASAGAHETEQGCVEKGFEQERRGPPEYSRLMYFLKGCLAAAKPTPRFCDQVPPYQAFMSPE